MQKTITLSNEGYLKYNCQCTSEDLCPMCKLINLIQFREMAA